jgi:hypothetical protein|tara:strand:- start:1949 stop:2509 length:561 start_codon:yes stop_codon:yes gene_type:complete
MAKISSMVIDDWGKIGVAVLTAVMMLGAFSGCIDSMDQIDFDCPPTYYYEGVTANLFFENMEYNDTKMRDYFFGDGNSSEEFNATIYDSSLEFDMIDSNNTTHIVAYGMIRGESAHMRVLLFSYDSTDDTFVADSLEELENMTKETFANETIKFEPAVEHFTSLFKDEFADPSNIKYEMNYNMRVC